ncbi:MAG TPA: rhodanese-like domain-containing protein [Geobacteraceae bacterium]
MKLRRWAVTLLVVLALPMLATAADYRYVKPDLFRSWLEIGKKMVIVDIQAPTDFGKRHIKGAVETNAYPVKSAEERQRLDKVLAEIAATSSDVVIVCPRGGGGAKNTFDYLVSRGVAVERLYILEKGMEGWPYGEEQCAAGR